MVIRADTFLIFPVSKRQFDFLIRKLALPPASLPTAADHAETGHISKMRKHNHIDKAMAQAGNPIAANQEPGDGALPNPTPSLIFLNWYFFPPEDLELCLDIIRHLYEDLPLNNSSDLMQAEMVAIYSLKLIRAQNRGNTEAAEIWDRMIRAHLKDLRASSKKAREGAATASRPHLSDAEPK